MSSTAIIVLVLVILVALVVIGLMVTSMRKKSREDDIARAEQLRRQADEKAAVLPEEDARAREAEAQAEQARIQAERAEERANEARTAVAQQEAVHEDQVRAADRLDPNVDHRSDDYTPTSSSPGTAQGSDRDPDTILDRDSHDGSSDGTVEGDATDGTTRT